MLLISFNICVIITPLSPPSLHFCIFGTERRHLIALVYFNNEFFCSHYRKSAILTFFSHHTNRIIISTHHICFTLIWEAIIAQCQNKIKLSCCVFTLHILSKLHCGHIIGLSLVIFKDILVCLKHLHIRSKICTLNMDNLDCLTMTASTCQFKYFPKKHSSVYSLSVEEVSLILISDSLYRSL